MKASIDIGSNTVLLLIGEVHGSKVIVIDEREKAPRLGKSVDTQKNLHPESMQRAKEAVATFKAIIDNEYPAVEHVTVTATSAVRDAQNRDAFIEQVKQETGYAVQVLSGEEEAKLMYRGANSVMDETSRPVMVIDIGGGSTEAAMGTGDEITDHYSFDMGSVRFTERYLKSDPPTESQLQECKEAIVHTIGIHPFKVKPSVTLIGIAGTVTSLTAIQRGITTYQPEKLKGCQLSLQEISSWISTFSNLTKARLLKQYPTILKGRAGVFLAGLLILEGFMKYYNIEDLVTSTGGVRHGALISELV
jgi:exopolyphosphatase/guanosine-5'-triphosphate,3'-diphosphate pyrophosphatase